MRGRPSRARELHVLLHHEDADVHLVGEPPHERHQLLNDDRCEPQPISSIIRSRGLLTRARSTRATAAPLPNSPACRHCVELREEVEDTVEVVVDPAADPACAARRSASGRGHDPPARERRPVRRSRVRDGAGGTGPPRMSTSPPSGGMSPERVSSVVVFPVVRTEKSNDLLLGDVQRDPVDDGLARVPASGRGR